MAEQARLDEEAKRLAEEKARKETEAELKAEEEARKLAEAEANRAAEEKARLEAEEMARIEADAEARRAAEKEAQLKAEAKAKREAEEAAKREAEAKAKRAAEEKARREAEAKAKREAKEQARLEAEAKRKAEEEARRQKAEAARREAEAKAKREAEEKARLEAEAKRKAEEEARRQKAEAARREAEAKAKREAEEKARLKAEAKAKREAEAKAKRDAEEKARLEAEAKAKREAEEKARHQAEKERKAREEAERKAREKAERKAREEAKRKAREEAERQAREEAERQAREEAERKAREEAEAKAREEEEERRAAEEAKRDLGETFRRLIRETGPISLAQYMGESNARYYNSRNPLTGAGDTDDGREEPTGDFITAPEISQMFGELVGLWLADLWVKMGASDNIHYVELGPGRGTLAKDVLRTAGKYGFNPRVHFVEGSLELRKLQRQAVPTVRFHDDLSTLPEDRPLLIVANEFFDALPIHQLVRSANGWHERMVGLDGDDLAFVAGDKPMDAIVPTSWKSASQGAMIETSPAASAIMAEIAQRLSNQGGVALIIDYGSGELRSGSTLQALKDHKKVDPLTHPGEADLTAHVDFEMLQEVAEKNGAEVMGLQTQGEWLRQLHIDTRMEALQRQSPRMAETVKRQRDRLVEDDQMGVLFKVLGICGRRWPHGEGFD